MDILIKIRNSLIAWKYRYLLKPLLFQFNPELVHNFFIGLGKFLGYFSITRWLTKICFGYHSTILTQEILGLTFGSPVGLAAGFDKNIELFNILPSLGFGFMEGGSVTGRSCAGNPKPRLWRLPKSKSLLVYYGLKNNGAQAISRRLRGRQFRFPLGISLAKTNDAQTVETEAGIADYLEAYRNFVTAKVGNYYTINISCPNTFGGEPFTDPNKLDRLLSTLASEYSPIAGNWPKPILLKLSPHLDEAELDQMIELAQRYRLSGFICSNLAKDLSNSEVVAKIKEPLPAKKGGVSGQVMADLANRQIAYLYRQTRKRFIIIGVGGIFNADDAYTKIKAGASLVQIITGLIFEGPQVVSQINQGLVKLLRRDGYRHISQAVGSAVAVAESQ